MVDISLNRHISYIYDANSNMTVLTNPSAIDHTFAYNAVDLRSAYTPPLSGSYTYLYDKDRRLMQKDFPSGDAIIWDNTNPANPAAKSRLRQVQTPDSTIAYTYLCANRIGTISRASEAIAYTYDGELTTSETLSGTLSKTLGYTYTNDFFLSSMTYAGKTQTFSYDSDGLLTDSGDFAISRYNNPNVNETGLPFQVTDNTLTLTRSFNVYEEQDSEHTQVNSQ